MPASEARIAANQANALKSTGPKTEPGKARSRANSYKHGLTGAGVVLSDEDADEVARHHDALVADLAPRGEVEHALAHRAATMLVRMTRCGRRDLAATSGRAREALDDFEAPEGVGEAEAERLRHEAAILATFDPSKEATLARRYEAAAERSFYRALKELRQGRAESKATRAAQPAAPSAPEAVDPGSLASFFLLKKEIAKLESLMPLPGTLPGEEGIFPADRPRLMGYGGGVDVPISIGRPRRRGR